MPNHKADRMSEDMHRELSAIMRELKDPRIAGKLLSIVRVDLSGDYSHVKVYISAMEGLDVAKEAVKGFVSAEGFIRRDLMSKLSIKKLPEFTFIADDSIEHSAHINKMLENLNKDQT